MVEKLANPPDYYCLPERVNQQVRAGMLLEISVLVLERAWGWVLLHNLNNSSLLFLPLCPELESGGAAYSLFSTNSSL